MENKESPIFDQPNVTELPFGLTRFSSNGLQIDIQRNDLSIPFQDRTTGQKLRVIRGMMVGTVDFSPFGSRVGAALVEGKRYVALARLIKGLNDFFALFNDPHAKNYPKYLIGGVGIRDASPEIVKFLEHRSGFLVDDTGNRLAVVAYTRDVKESLDQLNHNPKLVEKIIGMAEVEQST